MAKKMRLREIDLYGYKSINEKGQVIPINDDVTVMIGANGVGKSNIVSFFQMIGNSISGSLQSYIAQCGFADSFLYYGSKHTNRIAAKLQFSSADYKNQYDFTLSYAAGGTLIYTEETITFQNKSKDKPFVLTMDVGKKESQLYEALQGEHKETVRVFYQLLKNCQYFQFHDTSRESKIRTNGYIGDNRFLRDNAGNLAAFLYGIKQRPDGQMYYERIVRYVRLIMPQFGDFVLQPNVQNANYIGLDWHEEGSNYIFGPHQLSDGTLRFMALATLLLQPPKSIPSIIVLDEPELGLHPIAISVLSGLIKKASVHAQIIVATQSPRMVDEFDCEQIVVIERDEKEKTSVFKRLDKMHLIEWLNEYSTCELWDKNVIGGRP